MVTRSQRAILQHVRQIRAELLEPLTPRRKFDALVQRVLKRLDKIEAAIRADDEAEDLPDPIWLEAEHRAGAHAMFPGVAALAGCPLCAAALKADPSESLTDPTPEADGGEI